MNPVPIDINGIPFSASQRAALVTTLESRGFTSETAQRAVDFLSDRLTIYMRLSPESQYTELVAEDFDALFKCFINSARVKKIY